MEPLELANLLLPKLLVQTGRQPLSTHLHFHSVSRASRSASLGSSPAHEDDDASEQGKQAMPEEDDAEANES